MQTSVFFYSENGDGGFSCAMGCIPRVGDLIDYSFLCRDKDDWDEQSWEAMQKFSKKRWVVACIKHVFRKTRVMKPETHYVAVYLREQSQGKQGEGVDYNG